MDGPRQTSSRSLCAYFFHKDAKNFSRVSHDCTSIQTEVLPCPIQKPVNFNFTPSHLPLEILILTLPLSSSLRDKNDQKGSQPRVWQPNEIKWVLWMRWSQCKLKSYQLQHLCQAFNPQNPTQHSCVWGGGGEDLLFNLGDFFCFLFSFLRHVSVYSTVSWNSKAAHHWWWG